MGKKDDASLDIEIGRYALRTFKIKGDRLSSVVKNHFWDGGAVIAQCIGGKVERPHQPPGKDCYCGVYGTLTIDQLLREYREQAVWSVAVIAAEGETVIGDRGLRTAAARIVAYWCRDGGDTALAAYKAQCLDARHFTSVPEMLKAYNFPAGPDPADEVEQYSRVSTVGLRAGTSSPPGHGRIAYRVAPAGLSDTQLEKMWDHMLFHSDGTPVPWTKAGLNTVMAGQYVDWAWARLTKHPKWPAPDRKFGDPSKKP